jgi:hypothetical protein
MSPSPAPATSNGANGFPVRRFPARFAPRVMRPISRGALSSTAQILHAVVVEQTESRVEPRRAPPIPAEALPFPPPGLLGLRLDVQPPPQVLQTDGRHCQVAPAFHVGGGMTGQQGPFAPRALPRLRATPGPSATLSPSAHFPGTLVIGRTILRRFRGGTRRASPVARRVLVPVASLSPRRSGPPRQPACDGPCRLRPPITGSASGASLLSRLPVRSLPLRPEDLLAIPKMAVSMGFRGLVSLPPAIQATGPLARAPTGLTPVERARLRWTHDWMNWLTPTRRGGISCRTG